MSTVAQQLIADFDQVKKTLALYPDISIILTAGEPPDHYEIEYHLKGYRKNPDGTISPENQHRILIDLPFGYPHFPPSVKPLTPVFHPDIDPDAVRIADFWQETPSLAELVLHIGKMICGTYSPENPFNQEAFDWYEERRDWLPFDSVEMATGDDSLKTPPDDMSAAAGTTKEPVQLSPEEEEITEDDIPLASEAEGRPPDITTGQTTDELPSDELPAALDEEEIQLGLNLIDEDPVPPKKQTDEIEGQGRDLDEDVFAALGLDDESSPGESAEKEKKDRLRPVRPLIEQKEIFRAQRVLADIHDPASVPDFEELERDIAEATREAKRLYKKAGQLNQQGQLEKAGLLLDQVANVAIDYPGLESARNRIRENIMARLNEPAEPVTAGESAAGGEKTTAGKRVSRISHKKVSAKARRKIPYRQILAFAVFIVVAAGGANLYFKDSSNLKKAAVSWQQAQKLSARRQYKEAGKSLAAAQAALGKILFLRQSRTTMEQKINALADSRDFKEGLKGRVQYNGQYINADLAQKLTRFNLLLAAANKAVKAGKTPAAIKAMNTALRFAEQNGLQEQMRKIRPTLSSLQLQESLEQAKRAEEVKDWPQAAETYRKALELSTSLSNAADKGDIASRFAAASFHSELDRSKTAFTASEWQKTIEMLQRAEKILRKNPQAASAAEKKELHSLLLNSQLFQILSTAKKAYKKGTWDLAVQEYRQAIDLLQQNRDRLGAETGNYIDQIKKTILLTYIAREQSKASLTGKNEDIAATIAHDQAIVNLIEKSRFNQDPALKKILVNTRQQLATKKKQLEIKQKIDWLNANFQKIFLANYPSTRSSELPYKKVTFLKKVGNKLIFNLSCVEIRQGRSFGLELNYQYNPDTDSWSLYPGQ
ncbi:hypothetical protein MNBD_DELTA04-90 [hydrothermal vent metagenome]|uniref:UBC core domain-containing protein n=1 Tax=hydrothermal vent metagenome TaxID=652676 RepID=A0A3B0VE94_9ZZZZ